MVKVFTLTLAAGAKRVSDAYGDGAGVVNEAKNIPYRQLLLSATGADLVLGDSTLVTTNGVKLALTAPMPLSIGPFTTGPVKLSDLYAVGAGSTLQILGVPF